MKRKQVRRPHATQRKQDQNTSVAEKEWARRWFAGNPTCPQCGGVRLTRGGATVGGDTRLETWKCESLGCHGAWRLELRESALAVFDPDANALRAWHERIGFQPRPEFRIEIDGNVLGVRGQTGSVVPRLVPRFIVREYESDGSLDEDRISGVDAEGREYYDHDVDILDDDD